MKQFHVVFTNGDQDWVDPVVWFKEVGEFIVVGNGFYDYSFDKKCIESWEFLEIEE